MIPNISKSFYCGIWIPDFRCVMDILSLVVGIILGVIVAGMAIELASKKSSSSPERTSRISYTWGFAEIHNPKIVAEYLDDIDVPDDARVVCQKCKNEAKLVEKEIQMKHNNDISANFIVGDNRALILSGSVRYGEMGVWTVDPIIISKLQGEFERLWAEGQ